jgi:hypothetical protein
LLSSSIVDENNPALAEQLEKLKALASKLNDSVVCAFLIADSIYALFNHDKG